MRIFKVMFVWMAFSFVLTAIVTVPIGFRLLNPDYPYSSILLGVGFSLILADIFHRVCDYYADFMCQYLRF